MSFDKFTQTAEAILTVGSSLAKRELAANYFKDLDTDDLYLAALFLSGEPFPISDGRTINIGNATYRDAILAIFPDMSADDFATTFNKFSDVGITLQHILEQKRQTADQGVTLREVGELYTKLAETSGSIAKRTVMAEFLGRLNHVQAKYLQKITSGDLRIGFKEGNVENALAKAFDRKLDLIRLANMKTGNMGRVAVYAKEDRLLEAEFTLFHPIKVMLATAEATSDGIVERFSKEKRAISVEDKYDGMRCHLHHQDGRIELYTRDLNNVSISFPEVATLRFENTLLLDGEIVGLRGDKVVPFYEFQQRLGRKEVVAGMFDTFQIKYMVYDILYLDGKLLIDEPLSKRRELIRSLKLPEAAMISPARDVETAEDIEREFKLAKATRGNEGLMIKDPASKYTVGKRGYDWIKYKKALEPFDVVVVAAEQGHGKKNEYLSDLTFAVWNKDKTELVTLGKVFSGLKDSDIVTLTEWFKANTISSEGRVYQVKPEVILEVAYENIQESDRNESGYALRFPRIKAIRTDKPLDEINTIEDVKHIYEEFCKGGME
jgi:DNA ligase-1